MQWSYRFVSGVLVLASIIGMTFALYLEHVVGLEPCPLCIFQRVGLMTMGIVALIAFVHNPISNAMNRCYAMLTILGILWSVGVAARHVWIQTLPPDQIPSCGPGLNYLIDTLPLKTIMQQVLQGSGECAAIDWTFWGLALPVWSLIFFSFLLLICLWQIFRAYPMPNNYSK
ncbi:disulfide bond formation protein B [Acinetobacter seifertii]|uniref:disulfide bond formation protein B n=1 Tax=Acinetobacter seifertii TaxID=1530123 RepID=UPI003AF444FF